MSIRKNLLHCFPYIIIAVFSIILINNMFYGFSWTDEGLYLSNVQRYFSGDRFLIDDWTPTQFYEPLLYPLYALFIKVSGSTDGIFLFFRIATIIFQTISAFFTYTLLSKKYSEFSSCIASLIALSFSRACINGPSYYTIGFESYLIALLCLYAFFTLSYGKFFLFISGILFAASVLCNPFLVIPYIAISLAALIVPKSRKRIKQIAIVWFGTAISGIIYIIFVFSGNSISDIFSGLHYTYNDPSYKHTFILTIKRLYKMPRLLIFPYSLTWLPMIIACAVVKLKGKQLSSKIILGLHVLNTIVYLGNCIWEKDCGSAIMAFFHFTIFEAILISSLRLKDFLREYKNELFYFVIPGLILAYFFCFASDTGFGVCSIGMAVAVIGEILITEKILKNLQMNEKKKVAKAAKNIPLIILVSFTFFYRTNLVYRDATLPPHILFVPQLHTNIEKITEGPVKGIYTTKRNRTYYDDLLAVLRNISNNESQSEKSIFISGAATWAYTAFSNLHCNAPTTWRTFCDDVRLQTYYEDFPKKSFPEYLIVLDSKNPDNGGRYEGQNAEENIKDTWIFKKMQNMRYEKQVVSCGIIYSPQTAGK